MKKILMLLFLVWIQPVLATSLWVEKEKDHTAVIIERADIARFSPTLDAISGDGAYVRFGWGDRKVFGSSARHAGDIIKALLIPGKSALEVTPMESLDDAYSVRKISFTDAQLEQAILAIAKTLEGRTPQLLRREDDHRDYYRATRRYHLLANCNHWTARMLKNADLKVPYLASTFSGPLMRKLDRAVKKRDNLQSADEVHVVAR